MTNQKNIAVYCGSSKGNNPNYVSEARALGHELVKRGYGLVYGGGNVGLMGEIGQAVVEKEGSVIGLIPEFMMEWEVGFVEGGDLRVVPDMHTRKGMMAELADGFIAMPGGFGTFEEIFEAVTWSQLGLHAKPCGFLNVNGYYDHLIAFIDKAIAEGFIHPTNRGLLVVADNAIELMDLIENFERPVFDKVDFAKKMTKDE